MLVRGGKYVPAIVIRVGPKRIYASYGDGYKKTGGFPMDGKHVWKMKNLSKRQRGGGREVSQPLRGRVMRIVRGRRRPSIECVYPGETPCTKNPIDFCGLITRMLNVPCRRFLCGEMETPSAQSLTRNFAADLQSTMQHWFKDHKEFELLCPNLGVSPFLHPARHSVPCVYLYEGDTSDLSACLRKLYRDVVQSIDAAEHPGLPTTVLQQRWIIATMWHISLMVCTMNEKNHARLVPKGRDVTYKCLEEGTATLDNVSPSLPLVCDRFDLGEWWLNLQAGDTRYSYDNPRKAGVKLEIVVRHGDITKYNGRPAIGHQTAIVNAANSLCLGGGGVDGCIHRAAGPDLLRECASLPFKNSQSERCPVGEAVVTSGHQLNTNHIIHAVGPRFSASDTMADKNDKYKDLCNAYRAIARKANAYDVQELAIPLLSNGIFRGPQHPADVIRCGISALVHTLTEKVLRGNCLAPHPVRRVIIYGFTPSEFRQINDAIVTLLPTSELKKAAFMLSR